MERELTTLVEELVREAARPLSGSRGGYDPCSRASATLDALVSHFDREGARAKVVGWEHNSHVGDARATQMGQAGVLNVVYLPQTERQSHYFHARLANQSDAVIHFDHTRAVEPLERVAGWAPPEVPETCPTGI